jgi:putative ABC transport system substrate-binding protein
MTWFRAILATALLALTQLLALTPNAATAQPAAKVYRVGILHVGAPNTSILGETFVKSLADRGYRIGANLVLYPKPMSGKLDGLEAATKELVADHVDVIVTSGYPAAIAADRYARATPIVVVNSGDPVRTRLVASLSRPGGHITGVSEVATELSAKRLQILEEAIPSARKIAVLWNADDLGMTLRYQATEEEAPQLGVTIVPLGVHAPDDFDAAFSAMTRSQPDAIMMVSDVLTNLNRKRVMDFADEHRIPAIFEYENLARDGGLMSYGPDVAAMFDRAADLVDRILKGAKPGDLPLELPTIFHLAVNLKTAKAIDLEIPASILARADEVIE